MIKKSDLKEENFKPVEIPSIVNASPSLIAPDIEPLKAENIGHLSQIAIDRIDPYYSEWVCPLCGQVIFGHDSSKPCPTCRSNGKIAKEILKKERRCAIGVAILILIVFIILLMI